MPTSAARVEANRRNAAKSTGPKTAEGKAQSRRNGLKHGLTGQGIVLSDLDAAEVDRRTVTLQQELAPKSVMGSILVQQMAMLSVRMERGAKQEFAAIATRVRHAADEFDEARIAAAGELLRGIGEDPRGSVRRLLKTPEGVEAMVHAWEDLRADLLNDGKRHWTAAHLVQAANLIGLREQDARGCQLGALSRAVWGDFEALTDNDAGDLDDDPRKAWARTKLLAMIDDELTALHELYDTFDFETIAQDRAEAGDRALFDPSKEASLARRYESEARRGFFRSLKELRKVEAEAADRDIAPPAAANPISETSYAPLASSCGIADPEPEEADDVATQANSKRVRVPSDCVETICGPDGQPLKRGRATRQD